MAIIDHPAREDCQWDSLELRDIPWGSAVFVLVGVLSHSGKFRAWLSDRQDQAHLVEGIDAVLRRLGGQPACDSAVALRDVSRHGLTPRNVGTRLLLGILRVRPDYYRETQRPA